MRFSQLSVSLLSAIPLTLLTLVIILTAISAVEKVEGTVVQKLSTSSTSINVVRRPNRISAAGGNNGASGVQAKSGNSSVQSSPNPFGEIPFTPLAPVYDIARGAVSQYTNRDPLDPSKPLKDYKQALLAQRRDEIIKNAGFQSSPMLIPAPASIMGFLETSSTTSASENQKTIDSSSSPTSPWVLFRSVSTDYNGGTAAPSATHAGVHQAMMAWKQILSNEPFSNFFFSSYPTPSSSLLHRAWTDQVAFLELMSSPPNLLVPARQTQAATGTTPSRFKPPVYLVPYDALGIDPYQNLNPFERGGKIHTLAGYQKALDRRENMAENPKVRPLAPGLNILTGSYFG